MTLVTNLTLNSILYTYPVSILKTLCKKSSYAFVSNFLNLGMCNMCNSINAQYHSIDQNLHTFVRPSGV